MAAVTAGTSLLFHVRFYLLLLDLHRCLRRQVRWSGIPITFRIFQCFVIHTVKGFGIVNKAEVDVFLELSCFFYHPLDVGNLTSGSSAFLNPTWTSGSSQFTYCWSLAWRILPFCISFSWEWSWSLLPVQCYKPPSIVLQALYLSDLIPWIYLSLPLYIHKGFDLSHTWMG